MLQTTRGMNPSDNFDNEFGTKMIKLHQFIITRSMTDYAYTAVHAVWMRGSYTGCKFYAQTITAAVFFFYIIDT